MPVTHTSPNNISLQPPTKQLRTSSPPPGSVDTTQQQQPISTTKPSQSVTTPPVKPEKGYIIAYDFTHYYAVPRDSERYETTKNIIENIPKLFYNVIGTLQRLLKQRDGSIDILHLCDKRLTKTSNELHASTSVHSSAPYRHLILHNNNNVEYTVIAARKELLKQLYDEIHLLDKLKICPKFITLFNIQYEHKTLVGSTHDSCKCLEYYANDNKKAKIYLYDHISNGIQQQQQQANNTTITDIKKSPPALKPVTSTVQPTVHNNNNTSDINNDNTTVAVVTEQSSTPVNSNSDLSTSSSNDNNNTEQQSVHNNNTQQQNASTITQSTSVNNLSVQLPNNSGQQRYITSLKNQINDLNNTIDELRNELQLSNKQCQQWKNKWVIERNNTIKLYDRIDSLKLWLQRGYVAIPAAASQIYTLQQRQHIPQNNITDNLNDKQVADEVLLRISAMSAIRTTDEIRTVPLETNKQPIDILDSLPSKVNPVSNNNEQQQQQQQDNMLLTDESLHTVNNNNNNNQLAVATAVPITALQQQQHNNDIQMAVEAQPVIVQ